MKTSMRVKNNAIMELLGDSHFACPELRPPKALARSLNTVTLGVQIPAAKAATKSPGKKLQQPALMLAGKSTTAGKHFMLGNDTEIEIDALENYALKRELSVQAKIPTTILPPPTKNSKHKRLEKTRKSKRTLTFDIAGEEKENSN